MLHWAVTTSGNVTRPRLAGHGWIVSCDAKKVGSSVPWKRAQCSVYVGMKLALMCCTSCTPANRKHDSWKSWGDQDDWMWDNKETTKTEITTVCQFWKGSNQGHLRSISLTPVWIKTMERFSFSPTDRNTQLMLVKLAVTAGCLVLSSNRSEQPNLM